MQVGRRRSRALVWAMLFALALPGPPARAETPVHSSPETIGRYALEQRADGLEVRRIEAPGLWRWLRAAGVVALVVGLLLVGRGVLPTGVVVAALGFASLAGGIAPQLDRRSWLFGEGGVTQRGPLGRSAHWRLDQLGPVEVRRRRPMGPETKLAGPPFRYEVRLPLRDAEGAAARFRLREEREAHALAARIDASLGR